MLLVGCFQTLLLESGLSLLWREQKVETFESPCSLLNLRRRRHGGPSEDFLLVPGLLSFRPRYSDPAVPCPNPQTLRCIIVARPLLFHCLSLHLSLGRAAAAPYHIRHEVSGKVPQNSRPFPASLQQQSLKLHLCPYYTHGTLLLEALQPRLHPGYGVPKAAKGCFGHSSTSNSSTI